jgi:chorismate mutase
MILEISQKATDLDYDGLMIETHRDPANAWSDAKQQVTPEKLGEILETVTFRNPTSRNKDFLSHLEELREEIDGVDQELYEIIATRMRIVDQIGYYKRDNNVTVFQKNRWKEISESRLNWARQLGLDADFMDEIFKRIHENSIRRQREIMNKSFQKTKDAS